MVGNVVGADVLNCLFVIGAAAFAKPLEVPAQLFQLPLPGHADHPLFVPLFHLHEQGRLVQALAGRLDTGRLCGLPDLQYAFNLGA
jgi:hypothetical protein